MENQNEGHVMILEAIRKSPLKKLDPAMLSIVLQEEARVTGTIDANDVYDAISLASYLHSGQTRANRGNLPRTPYIEHPLRNAIRILRWGCTDNDILIANILHDTVEDGSRKFALLTTKDKEILADEYKCREILSSHIENRFGFRATELVLAVSNNIVPDDMPKVEKNRIYAEHIAAVIIDPGVYLVKISDFVDNAAGLYHNDLPENHAKVHGMAIKYLPVLDIFEKLLNGGMAELLPINEAGVASIRNHLRDTRVRLEKIISQPVVS